MRGLKITCGALLAAVALLPSTSAAQRPGEITFFSDIGFRGQSFTANGSAPRRQEWLR